jgi:thioredoxin reductase (NADPH)
MRQVIILGAGPAGLTAAIYAARANLQPLVIAGYQAGGQLMLTTEVDNFPGFPDGVMGPELMERLRRQAERFGAEIVDVDAEAVDFRHGPLRVHFGGQTEEAQAVIIATGASAKWLDLPSEQRLIGRGVSSCATCDGFFFSNQPVVVVGGGDTAMEEALFLTRYASSVTVVHRRDTLRASKIMQQKAFANPKVRFVWDSVVEDVVGEEEVKSVRLRNLKTGEVSTIEAAGLFVAIGHTPNTQIFAGQLELDEYGYIVVHDETHTSLPGVFVAGDVQDPRYRQAISASGMGCMAAIDAERYLEDIHFQKGQQAAAATAA